jgi:hypothetical protein
MCIGRHSSSACSRSAGRNESNGSLVASLQQNRFSVVIKKLPLTLSERWGKSGFGGTSEVSCKEMVMTNKDEASGMPLV